MSDASGPPAGPPRTGDAAVDGALGDLVARSDEPVAEQVTAFEDVHRALQGRLADLDG